MWLQRAIQSLLSITPRTGSGTHRYATEDAWPAVGPSRLGDCVGKAEGAVPADPSAFAAAQRIQESWTEVSIRRSLPSMPDFYHSAALQESNGALPRRLSAHTPFD